MRATTRRRFIQGTLVGGCASWGIGAIPRVSRASARKTTDIKIEDISVTFEDFDFRTPFKFAGVIVRRQRMATVNCTVLTESGKTAAGFGVLPHNYTFTYPSNAMSPDDRLAAMKSLAEEIAKVTRNHAEYGHPQRFRGSNMSNSQRIATSRATQKMTCTTPRDSVPW